MTIHSNCRHSSVPMVNSPHRRRCSRSGPVNILTCMCGPVSWVLNFTCIYRSSIVVSGWCRPYLSAMASYLLLASGSVFNSWSTRCSTFFR